MRVEELCKSDGEENIGIREETGSLTETREASDSIAVPAM